MMLLFTLFCIALLFIFMEGNGEARGDKQMQSYIGPTIDGFSIIQFNALRDLFYDTGGNIKST